MLCAGEAYGRFNASHEGPELFLGIGYDLLLAAFSKCQVDRTRLWWIKSLGLCLLRSFSAKVKFRLRSASSRNTSDGEILFKNLSRQFRRLRIVSATVWNT